MKSQTLEVENIKDVRNLLRLEKLKTKEKEKIDTIITGIKSLFKLEKENKEINNRIIRQIRNLFRLKKESN